MKQTTSVKLLAWLALIFLVAFLLGSGLLYWCGKKDNRQVFVKELEQTTQTLSQYMSEPLAYFAPQEALRIAQTVTFNHKNITEIFVYSEVFQIPLAHIDIPGRKQAELLSCEQPVFLYDYPVQLASLAKSKATDASVAERFELYIAGIEIANGFSELCSPHIQRERFGQELEGIRRQGRRGKMPEFFLDSLAHYPESAGIALGLDRLLMLLTGKADIASVVPLTWSDLGA